LSFAHRGIIAGLIEASQAAGHVWSKCGEEIKTGQNDASSGTASLLAIHSASIQMSTSTAKMTARHLWAPRQSYHNQRHAIRYHRPERCP